jgi:hypothetical protein
MAASAERCIRTLCSSHLAQSGSIMAGRQSRSLFQARCGHYPLASEAWPSPILRAIKPLPRRGSLFILTTAGVQPLQLSLGSPMCHAGELCRADRSSFHATHPADMFQTNHVIHRYQRGGSVVCPQLPLKLEQGVALRSMASQTGRVSWAELDHPHEASAFDQWVEAVACGHQEAIAEHDMCR